MAAFVFVSEQLFLVFKWISIYNQECSFELIIFYSTFATTVHSVFNTTRGVKYRKPVIYRQRNVTSFIVTSLVSVMSQVCHCILLIRFLRYKYPAVQRQTAVTAYFSSKQLLLFTFAWRHCRIQS